MLSEGPGVTARRGLRARIGAIAVTYDDCGDGVPLLFIHGFPHNRALWTHQLQGLCGRCRCIAPDLRGFGGSTAVPPYSMDQYADDIARLLDALAIERAVVAGLSMGGSVTFAFWRRHRDRVLALVLAGTRAAPDDQGARERRRAMIALARSKGTAAVADAMIDGMVGATSRVRSPEVVAAVHAMLAAGPVEGAVGALEAMMARPDSTPMLQSIDAPVLIVVGEEDTLTPPSVSEAMHAAIKRSRLEIIPAAGHVSCLERPAAFNMLLAEFVHALDTA